jgi:hypothetical protein
MTVAADQGLRAVNQHTGARGQAFETIFTDPDNA